MGPPVVLIFVRYFFTLPSRVQRGRAGAVGGDVSRGLVRFDRKRGIAEPDGDPGRDGRADSEDDLTPKGTFYFCILFFPFLSFLLFFYFFYAIPFFCF